jgi:hypothetical protein
MHSKPIDPNADAFCRIIATMLVEKAKGQSPRTTKHRTGKRQHRK